MAAWEMETEHHRWFRGDPVLHYAGTGASRALGLWSPKTVRRTIGWSRHVHTYTAYLGFFWGN